MKDMILSKMCFKCPECEKEICVNFFDKENLLLYPDGTKLNVNRGKDTAMAILNDIFEKHINEHLGVIKKLLSEIAESLTEANEHSVSSAWHKASAMKDIESWSLRNFLIWYKDNWYQ